MQNLERMRRKTSKPMFFEALIRIDKDKQTGEKYGI